MKNSFNSKLEIAQKGFTLIELLIVIVILGILATAVLVAMDPVEQINRGKDSGRISSIGQLGHAIQAYYTSQNAAYPALATWQTVLVSAGEIKQTITIDPAATNCNVNIIGNACYTSDLTTNAIVWTVLNSKSSATKAGCAGATPVAIAAWDAGQGKAGIGCVAASNSTPAYGIVLR